MRKVRLASTETRGRMMRPWVSLLVSTLATSTWERARFLGVPLPFPRLPWGTCNDTCCLRLRQRRLRQALCDQMTPHCRCTEPLLLVRMLRITCYTLPVIPHLLYLTYYRLPVLKRESTATIDAVTHKVHNQGVQADYDWQTAGRCVCMSRLCQPLHGCRKCLSQQDKTSKAALPNSQATVVSCTCCLGECVEGAHVRRGSVGSPAGNDRPPRLPCRSLAHLLLRGAWCLALAACLTC